MSYEKAMKHWKNPKKGKAQYMGFDTGSGFKSVRSNPYLDAILNVRAWFKERNEGSHLQRVHTRECIREAVADARAALAA